MFCRTFFSLVLDDKCFLIIWSKYNGLELAISLSSSGLLFTVDSEGIGDDTDVALSRFGGVGEVLSIRTPDEQTISFVTFDGSGGDDTGG